MKSIFEIDDVLLRQTSMKFMSLISLSVGMVLLTSCGNGHRIANELNKREQSAGRPIRWVVKKDSLLNGMLLEREMIPMPVTQTRATEGAKRDALAAITKAEGGKRCQIKEVRQMPDSGDGWALNEVWTMKNGASYLVKMKPSARGGTDIRMGKL